MTEDELRKIKIKKSAGEVAKTFKKFKIGDEVMILKSAFKDYSGSVSAYDEETKSVSVDVTVLGRVTPIKLNENEVRKI